MTEAIIHKILVVENNEDLRLKIDKILMSEGFEVQCVSSADDAFACLDNAYDDPFAVIISGYQMPKMRGDIILKTAKKHSPRTRRMLLAHAGDMETVINAINIAEIHGCLSLPFKNHELTNQVNERCREFDAFEKKRVLKRITGTQNRQLYRIALNFRNKEQSFINQIEEKRKRIRVLKAKISVFKDQRAKNCSANLEKLLENDCLPLTPECFAKKFVTIKDEIKKNLEQIVADVSEASSIIISDIDYETIASCTSQLKNEVPGDQSDFSGDRNKSVRRSDELFDSIIQFSLMTEEDSVGIENTMDENNTLQQNSEKFPDEFFELIVSEDRLTALIKIKKTLPEMITVSIIEEFLKKYDITFGIKDDTLIKIWLSNATVKDEPFVIARGISPVFPVDAKIKYHFQTDFKKAGKILPDGSIDFKDRGDIPFVKADTLLAEKTEAVFGKSGIDIFGEEIPVAEPVELSFGCGTGTRFSDDKLKIFADSDGMPHMDIMGGNISVLSELVIPEDVDYKTGNLDFNGNIVVKGVVKAGFSIKCANLTVKQIQGAEIDLSGDLNVAAGIVDAHLIKVQGNIQAKYINNSIIKAFGDIIIQKEIIDSKLLLSGRCINETGHIISSYVSAKKGVIAGNIGTEVSLHSTIKVGHNEHIEFFLRQTDDKINKNTELIKSIKKELTGLDSKNHKLNTEISELAFIQDRSQVKLRDIQKKLGTLQKSGDIMELKNISGVVDELQKKIKNAGHKLDIAFIRQDKITEKIEEKENSIKTYEKENKQLLQYKKNLKKYSDLNEPVPELKVKKKIMTGTIVVGPKSSTRIQQPVTRCRIMEIEMKEEGNDVAAYYKMDITDL